MTSLDGYRRLFLVLENHRLIGDHEYSRSASDKLKAKAWSVTLLLLLVVAAVVMLLVRLQTAIPVKKEKFRHAIPRPNCKLMKWNCC